jgi:hypothetical protein
VSALGAAAVSERLRALARLSDLRSGRRLATKVDMSPRAVTRRLELMSELRRCCLLWKRWGDARRA